MDQYYIKSRLFPTIITSIPLLLLLNYFAFDLYLTLNDVMLIIPILFGLSVNSALVYLLIQVNRYLSKFLFQSVLFEDDMHMPSTNLLLFSDDRLDNKTKEKIKLKIYNMYNIVLPTKIEEDSDEIQARKQIAFAISQIRISLRNNKMLLRHNIEYGFVRNLIGGSVIAVFFALTMVFLSYVTGNLPIFFVSNTLLILYLLPILLSRHLISWFGNNYAEILFQEFMAYEKLTYPS